MMTQMKITTQRTIRQIVFDELDYAVKNDYAKELVEVGTTIYTVEPVYIAYTMMECDLSFERGTRSADLIPHIADWQNERRPV